MAACDQTLHAAGEAAAYEVEADGHMDRSLVEEEDDTSALHSHPHGRMAETRPSVVEEARASQSKIGTFPRLG
eukprot:scaffold3600_cov171-Amphora_coffeaeformis.AAC.11